MSPRINRSIYGDPVPATDANPGTIEEALRQAEEFVAAVLAAPAHKAASRRAARCRAYVNWCRDAIRRGDVADAAWQAYCIGRAVEAHNHDLHSPEIFRGVANQRSQGNASKADKRRQGYDDAAEYMVRAFVGEDGKPLQPNKMREQLSLKAKKVGDAAVQIIEGGKRIEHSHHAPITWHQFRRVYLKPARDKALKKMQSDNAAHSRARRK